MKALRTSVVSATKNKPVFPFTHFLRAYTALGISMIEAMVVLQHTTYWWTNPKLPFPGDQTVADRMGVDRSTVVRAKKRLVKRGFLRIITRFEKGRRTTSKYDYTALIPIVEAKYVQLVEEEKARRSREYQYTEYDAQTGEILTPDEQIEAMAVGYPIADAVSDTLVEGFSCSPSAPLYEAPESHTVVTLASHTDVTPEPHRKLSEHEEVLERDQNRSSLSSAERIPEASGFQNPRAVPSGQKTRLKRGEKEEKGKKESPEILSNPEILVFPGKNEGPTLVSPKSPDQAIAEAKAKTSRAHAKVEAKRKTRERPLDAIQSDETLNAKEKLNQTVSALYKKWNGALKTKFPGAVIRQSGRRDIGILQALVKEFGLEDTELLLACALDNWAHFRNWRFWYPSEPSLPLLRKDDVDMISVAKKVVRYTALARQQRQDPLFASTSEMQEIEAELTRIGFTGDKGNRGKNRRA